MSGRDFGFRIAAPLAVMLVAACTGGTDRATPEPASALPTAPAAATTEPGATIDSDPTERAVQPTAPPPEGGVAEITIGTPATNETLYLPDRASVATGDMVRLNFVNSTNTPHNLTFEDPINAASDPYVEPGQSSAFTFTAPTRGDYQFYCTLHPWMTGTLTVTPR